MYTQKEIDTAIPLFNKVMNDRMNFGREDYALNDFIRDLEAWPVIASSVYAEAAEDLQQIMMECSAGRGHARLAWSDIGDVDDQAKDLRPAGPEIAMGDILTLGMHIDRLMYRMARRLFNACRDVSEVRKSA